MKKSFVILICIITALCGLFAVTACGKADTRETISVEGDYKTIDNAAAAEKLGVLNPKIEGNFEAKSWLPYNPYYEEVFEFTCVAEYSDGKMQMNGSDVKKMVTSYTDGIYSYEIFPYGDPMEIMKIRQTVEPGYYNSMLGYFPVDIADEMNSLCQIATEIGIVEDGDVTKFKLFFDDNYYEFSEGSYGDVTICLVFVGSNFNNMTFECVYEGNQLISAYKFTSKMYPTDKNVTVPDDLNSYKIT